MPLSASGGSRRADDQTTEMENIMLETRDWYGIGYVVPAPDAGVKWEPTTVAFSTNPDDEMDAPVDFDSGNVCFDPYV